MESKEDVLKKYFGHSQFRQGQKTLVDSFIDGKDVMGIMPTGAGKSVCYQLPAVMASGTAIVVSPLISLMNDQVQALVRSGIRAAYINSSLTYNQYIKALTFAQQGLYKIIYVAPERLELPEFRAMCSELPLSLIAVDEAHCVSQWGQDFRPSYLLIDDFIRSLPHRPPVGAFTATATDEVKDDIRRLLHLNDPVQVTTGFDRPNLFFGVRTPKKRDDEVCRLVSQRREQSGIIYCATRKNTEKVCELLRKNGFEATRYHAGLSDKERRENQDDFIYDRCRIMVATNAFGMGIDKSNVSYVIHYNMPKNIESYYQEAGRAGRDGTNAECILLYNGSDIFTNKFLIENSESELDEAEREALRERELSRLNDMIDYCTGTGCLRKRILEYFGEECADKCDNCSGCVKEPERDAADITAYAVHILSCIASTAQRYGAGLIASILKGGKNERIRSLELDKNPSYGKLASLSEQAIKAYIDSMIKDGYIRRSNGEYPVLQLTDASYNVMFKGEKVSADVSIAPVLPKAEKTSSGNIDKELLFCLKKLRTATALDEKVPAYIIFSDAALEDMCRKLPTTEEEFLTVTGVGEVKLSKYGEEFMSVIRSYVEHGGVF